MKYIFTSVVILLVTFYTATSYSNKRPEPGAVIKDKDSYPFYQHSQLIEKNESPTLVLKSNPSDADSIVINILNNMKVPYQVLSESPAVFQTDWISWHHDDESGQTLSSRDNQFFSLNTRDKYKFKISIINNEQHAHITLDKVNREQEVDVTPDTAMTWLKWKAVEPDKKAINAFMQRLQTEYEIHELASNKPVTNIPITQNIAKAHSNHISLPINVNQAWAILIQQLKQKSISLASVHNNQHMLNIKWLYAEFIPETNILNTSSVESQRHQFQIIAIPGSTTHSSSIYVYHTAFQQQSETSTWSDNSTQEPIAGAFLDLLKFDQ